MKYYDTWNNICFVLFFIFIAFTIFLFYGAFTLASEGKEFDGMLQAGVLWCLPTFLTLLYSDRLI